MNIIARYDYFELVSGISDSQVPVGIFFDGSRSFSVRGFTEASGNDRQGCIRFMPDRVGEWTYEVRFGDQTLSGAFRCTQARPGNHGPVRTEGMHFVYDDGTPYKPIGTTLYAWIHQTPALMEQTLQTLSQEAFNKVRMCVFPKSMAYNHNDPDLYPFLRDEDGRFDTNRPDSRYWRHLEGCIGKLAELGIQADLILFHPYDRWGFSTMAPEENLRYLSYAIRRLSAFHNVWWSLANEYEFSFQKDFSDWDSYGEMLRREDPCHHLISIHNWVAPYPKRDWMTHVSYQGGVQNCPMLRREYGLPFIDDECNYEGDIVEPWGNLSGFEMVNRMWYAVACGCYVTHGETFYREDEILWWAKGGKLCGQSPERIRFLRAVLDSIPGYLEPVPRQLLKDPNQDNQGASLFAENQDKIARAIARMPDGHFPNEMHDAVAANRDCMLIYLSRMCQSRLPLSLPAGSLCKVEVIDVWEMTRTTVMENASGYVTVPLPGKEGTAVLVSRLSGDPLV